MYFDLSKNDYILENGVVGLLIVTCLRSVISFRPECPSASLLLLQAGLMPFGALSAITARNRSLGLPSLFFARASHENPSLNASLDSFVASCLSEDFPVELHNHERGRHAFDILEDDPTREIIGAVRVSRCRALETRCGKEISVSLSAPLSPSPVHVR